MLTYSSIPQKNHERQREYPWALLLLVFVWLWPGVFSHDLWKPTEPQLFYMIQETRFAWLPTFQDKPNFEVAPVYIFVAQLFQKLLTPWAAEPFAATRFASVFFTTLGLLGSGMAGYRFLGKYCGRSVVLILIGSVGLLPIGHFLGAQSPIFAGVGLALWGYSVAQRQVVFSSILIGLGTTLLAQSVGLIGALLVLFSGSLLCLSQVWRSNRYYLAHLCAWAVTLPLLTVYPVTLLLMQPHAFNEYMQTAVFGSFGGLQHFQAAFHFVYFVKHSLWFTFPALPLTFWTLSRGGILKTKVGVFAVSWLIVFGLFLIFMPLKNQNLLVLILPILALLGAAQLDHLRRGAAAFLNWFGIMTFGLAAIFLWVGFVAMNYGFPAKLAERAVYFSPFYTRKISIMPMLVAGIFTPMWIIAITRKRIRGRQAITNWAAGTTLVWALLMTLFLPWIDSAKSYRPIVQQMQSVLPENTLDCVFIKPQHQDAWLAWQQYARIHYRDDERCRYHLVEYRADEMLPEKGKILWQGRRPRNKTERFALIDMQS